MSVSPNWQQFVVYQREANTGCIPTGYEMLLRAAGVDYVDFSTFQEEFDLDLGKSEIAEAENNFDSVANAICAKYPSIKFKRKIFEKGEGQDKLKLIQTFLEKSQFLLVSLALEPFRKKGWHIMPVVDSDEENIYLVNGVDEEGEADICDVKKADFIHIHDNFAGGKDVAYLDRW